MRAMIVLTPAESKRLIAKAVVQMETVREALADGYVVVAGGTTNAYIVEEIEEKEIDRALYTAGIVTRGVACSTPLEKRAMPTSTATASRKGWSWASSCRRYRAPR